MSWFKRTPPPPAAPKREEPRLTLLTGDGEVDYGRDMRMDAVLRAAIPPPSHRVITPAGAATDSADDCGLKAQYQMGFGGMSELQLNWYASQGFIGYQACALLAQHWLVRKACAMPARDAVAKGYDIVGADDQLLARIRKANKRYKLDSNLREFVTQGRVFGLRLAYCVIDTQDPRYYVKPFDPRTITQGSYRGISQIDPQWVTPELTASDVNDPAAIGFYEPTYWVINGRRMHKSHVIIYKGDDVADVLKPVYNHGGVSVPQKIYERVYAAERTANEAPRLAASKRTTVLYTDSAAAIANRAKFEANLSTWARYRDNYGVKVADSEGERVEQHDTALSDLDVTIMTQYQLVAAAADVPATKLLGTVPKGFNSTGDYEQDSYHEELRSIQVNDLEPLIDRHHVCLLRSMGVDATLEIKWCTLDTMTAAEQADVNLKQAQADKIYSVDIQAVGGDEVRAKLAADVGSGYNGLETLDNADPQEA